MRSNLVNSHGPRGRLKRSAAADANTNRVVTDLRNNSSQNRSLFVLRDFGRMKGWTYCAVERAYPRAMMTRISAQRDPPARAIRAAGKEVLLDNIVSCSGRGQFLSRPFRATDDRLTKILMCPMSGVDRVAFTRGGVGEGQTVRGPFGQQKDEKPDRDNAAQVPSKCRLPIRSLHDSGSLAISFYAGKTEEFRRLSFSDSQLELYCDEDTFHFTPCQIELGPTRPC